MAMDDSILSRFPDDDHVLGPFLGNLPPEILDVVVRKLGWFQTTFALAAKTCPRRSNRVPSAVLTEEERERLEWSETSPLAVAAMEADVEALEWLIQLFEAKRLNWLDVGTGLSCLAAGRGKLESLTCLRANGCPWDEDTCLWAAEGGTWRCCSGHVRTGARGTGTRAQRRRWEGTWRCCSGRVRTGARGMSGRAGGRRC